MAKTVTATEAKNKLGQILDMAIRDQPVIISNYGRPSSVVISYDEYEEYKSYRKDKNKTLWEKLEKLRKKAVAKNTDLTEEEANKIAMRARDEILDSIVKRKKDKFVKS